MSTAPFGTRRIEITSLARQKMTPDEKAEVEQTCRSRGLRLNIMWSSRDRAYSALVVAGGRSYEALASTPVEAFRRALAQRDGPRIASLLDPGDAA